MFGGNIKGMFGADGRLGVPSAVVRPMLVPGAMPPVMTIPPMMQAFPGGLPMVQGLPMPAPRPVPDFASNLVSALQGHVPTVSQAPADGLQSQLLASLTKHTPNDLGSSSETQELFRMVQNRIKAEPTNPVKAEPQPLVPALPTVPVKTEGSVRRLVKAEVVDVEDDNGLPPAPFPVRHKRTKTEAGIGDQPPAKRKMEDDDESDDGQPHRLPPGFGAIPEDIVEERQRQREEERILQLKATQPCRFGKKCKKRDCPNAHLEGREIDSELNPCAFGRRCKRQGCFYDHPDGRLIDADPTKGMCKFGVQCARADCLYSHPEGRAAVGLEPKVCFFCHQDGHIATECPRNPESWCYDRSAAMRAAQGEIKALTAG